MNAEKCSKIIMDHLDKILKIKPISKYGSHDKNYRITEKEMKAIMRKDMLPVLKERLEEYGVDTKKMTQKEIYNHIYEIRPYSWVESHYSFFNRFRPKNWQEFDHTGDDIFTRAFYISLAIGDKENIGTAYFRVYCKKHLDDNTFVLKLVKVLKKMGIMVLSTPEIMKCDGVMKYVDQYHINPKWHKVWYETSFDKIIEILKEREYVDRPID